MKFPVCGPPYATDIEHRVAVSGFFRFSPLKSMVTPDKIVVLKNGSTRQNPRVLISKTQTHFWLPFRHQLGGKATMYNSEFAEILQSEPSVNPRISDESGWTYYPLTTHLLPTYYPDFGAFFCVFLRFDLYF